MATPVAPVFTVKENASSTCYLTAGGYLVTLDENLIAPPNLCPGQSAMGNKTINGWLWRADGNIAGLQPTWGEKLQIVKLMDFPIPKPPAGYKYLDGYPQWRAPKAGEWFAESDTYVEKTYKDLSVSYLIVSPVTKEDCVDITDSHPDLVPREEIDYYDGPLHQFQITEKGSIRKTIKEWRESYCKFRHYCLPEHVPPKEKAVSTEVIKAGDFVECVDASTDTGLVTKGSKYTVLDYSGGSIIKIKDDRGKDLWFVASKFKKVEKPTSPPEEFPQYYSPVDIRACAFIKRINANEFVYVQEDGAIIGIAKNNWDKNYDNYYKNNKITEQEALSKLNKAVDKEYPQYYIPENTALFAYIEVINKDKYRCVRINGEIGSEVSVNLTKFENRKKITKEEALARISSAPPKITNLCVEIAGPPQSHFSYWVTEPIGNMYRAAKSSVRYILVSTVLAAVGYTAYNPTKVAGFVKSCLPKINIEWGASK